MSLHLAHIK